MNEILAALLGALVGAIVTGGTSYYLLKYNYKALFAKTVSENRMIWIRNIREAATKIISIYIVYVNSQNEIQDTDNCEIKLNLEKEFYENISVIRTRLNLKENRHQIFDMYLKKLRLDKSISTCQVEEDINFFIRDIMKDEWERVKKEARGKSNV